MFWFRLAGHLHKTIGELFEMSPMEWMYWRAFDALYPLGHAGDDRRTAKLCATIVNWAGKSATREIPLEDFIPQFNFEKPDVDEAIKAALLPLVGK